MSPGAGGLCSAALKSTQPATQPKSSRPTPRGRPWLRANEGSRAHLAQAKNRLVLKAAIKQFNKSFAKKPFKACFGHPQLILGAWDEFWGWVDWVFWMCIYLLEFWRRKEPAMLSPDLEFFVCVLKTCTPFPQLPKLAIWKREKGSLGQHLNLGASSTPWFVNRRPFCESIPFPTDKKGRRKGKKGLPKTAWKHHEKEKGPFQHFDLAVWKKIAPRNGAPVCRYLDAETRGQA